MQVKALVADDEAPLRDHLCSLLTKLWPEMSVIAMADDGAEALSIIQSQSPDVAFLDIKMPVMSGLQVAAQAGSLCHIVFVTAYDEYAVEAFEQAAVDYLLKLVDEGRLSSTIQRLKRRINTPPFAPDEWSRILQNITRAVASDDKPAYLRWVRATTQDATVLIAVEDIYFFKADNKYTSVVTKDAEFLINKPLKDLQCELEPDRFWRIHRGVIVNVSFIAWSKKGFNGVYRLHLKDKTETLTVSRSYAHLFKHI